MCHIKNKMKVPAPLRRCRSLIFFRASEEDLNLLQTQIGKGERLKKSDFYTVDVLAIRYLTPVHLIPILYYLCVYCHR